MHVADGLNSRVQVFELDGTYVYEYGTYGESDELGTVTTMRRVSVVPDGSGDMWTADLWGQRSQKWNRTTDGATFELQVGGLEPAPTSTAVFHEPRGIAFTPSGETLVVDTVHHRFARFNSDGDLLGTCGERAVEGATLGQYNWPRGIAVDQQTGDIWVADTKQNRLQVLAADCTPELYIGDAFRGSEPNQWDWPYDIDIRESDRVAWVTDTQNNRIKSIDVATREVIALHGLPGGGPDRYRSPGGIEVHPSTGHVYVADTGNNRIVELLRHRRRRDHLRRCHQRR